MSASWVKFRGENVHLQKEATIEYRRALKGGVLEPRPCAVCAKPRTEGHHEDYAKPLEVIWLCRLHHSERHQGYTIRELYAREFDRIDRRIVGRILTGRARPSLKETA